MVEDSLAAGRMFGMIQPDRSQPDVATGGALFQVGCLGRLSSFSETDDGRLLITLTGLIRFRVLGEQAPRRGYRRCQVTYAPFAADLGRHPVELGGAREALLAPLRGYFAHRGLDANWESINQMTDEALITTLGMACPFDAAEKQALLEAPDTTSRAATLLALLRFAVHDPMSDPSAGGGDVDPKRSLS